MADESFRDEYAGILRAYLDDAAEEHLVAAAELGRRLLESDTPPEEVAELQEQALERLARARPAITLKDAVPLLAAPLMEVLRAYRLGCRARRDSAKRAPRRTSFCKRPPWRRLPTPSS